MLNGRYDTILDSCLEQVRSGRATVGDCLRRYPDLAEDLAAELELAVAVAELPKPRMRRAAAQRQRLLLEYEFKRRQARAAPRPVATPLEQIAAVLGRLFPQTRALAPRLVAAVLALTLMGSWTISASAKALPYEPLYTVKLATENVAV